MKLEDLVGTLEVPMLMGVDNVDTTNIQSDSRRVTRGPLFVTAGGTAVDGHAYMSSATEKGVVTIVCEEAPSYLKGRCPFIVVKDSTEALNLLVSRWYDDPSGKLVLVDVTSTGGKTTIATLLYEMFRKTERKVGLLSAICSYIDGEAVPTDHTTPNPLTSHFLMARMVKAGCEYAFVEVSSHSVGQRRVSGLPFDGGTFTNLVCDHPDYHKTAENYLKAKKGFFDDLPAGTPALTNTDDKFGLVMLQNTRVKKLTCPLRVLTDFKGKILGSRFEGTDLIINNREVIMYFVERLDAYNLLAVCRTVVSLGRDPEKVSIVLNTPHSTSGRFEAIQSPPGYTTTVGHAHTPGTLTNALDGIYGVLDGEGRIVTVADARGDRDRGKRPLMVKEAARLSDQVTLTSDDPHFEEPDGTINDMIAGLARMDMKCALCITDHTQTIKTATMLAKKGDVILAIGKDHEDCQEIEGVEHRPDDHEELHEIFSTQ